MRLLRHSLLFATILSAAGCQLLAPRADDPVMLRLNEIDQRLVAIERVIQNQSLVELTQQVTALERRIDELNGKTESLEYNAETTAARQRELFNDIDARLSGLEKALQVRAEPSVLDGGPLPPGGLPVPGGSDDANYRAAFELVKEQRYDAAERAFKAFLSTFPDSEHSPNAQYWLAESHYVRQEFTEALEAFQKVINEFPGSRKVVDALLKVGYCNYELQRWDAAKTALARVQQEYPDTTAARLAGQRLERMQNEGV
ncbi:MAG: tol-pal system protein YbgF [Woeseiaceae bacterium]|nr:tol-pal system protein YbgF [Woeseiaceae bacterium]